MRVGDETGFYRYKIDIVAQGVDESVGAEVEKQSVIDYRLGAGADVSAARRLRFSAHLTAAENCVSCPASPLAAISGT